MTPLAVWQRMRHYGAAAGLDPAICHPHAAQHTALSALAERRVPLPRIQQFSGHRSIQSVQNYLHAADAIRENAAWEIPY